MKKFSIPCVLLVSCLFLFGTTLQAQKKSKFGSILKQIESATGGKSETSTEKKEENKNATVQTSQTSEEQAIKPHLTANTKTFRINSFSADFFSDGLLCVLDHGKGKYGFLDTEGNKKIDFVWDTHFRNKPAFDNGYCVLHKTVDGKRRAFIVDHDGKEVMLPASYWNVSDFSEDRAIVFDNSSGKTKVFFVDHTGKPIFPELTRAPKYTPADPDKPRPYKEGLAAFYDVLEGTWGFHNKSGKLVIPAIYKEVDNFSEGLAAVLENTSDGSKGKWGYIDQTGKMVIEPKFSHRPSCFSSGKAVVQKQNGKRCYIDKTGNVISPEFDRLTPFYQGYAFANTPEYGGSKIVVINESYAQVDVIERFAFPSQEGYDVVRFFDDVAAVGSNSTPQEIKGRIIDHRGKTLITQSGTNASIGNFFNGLAYCKARLEKVYYDGYINKRGEYVFIFQKEEF